ncbi:RNA-directed DNA polymerase, eukaryota, reverse transcriptase zinc-binding domain protein [Tanacetum coccineum]|uniref:RNA-directed DNA polymerase, eukaryota, reverse transcriptase zinc-binding domain protein n=1 Tax=Tanacetum coccineum TaxID=301880 RepID=A0ABQ4WR63_9ASTR
MSLPATTVWVEVKIRECHAVIARRHVVTFRAVEANIRKISKGYVTTLQGQVTALQRQVTALQGQVTTLQGQQGPAGGPAQPELPEEAVALVEIEANVMYWVKTFPLATRASLSSRGVNISSTLCPLCENEDESIDRILISCPRVLSIWRKIWSWWHLPPPTSFPLFSIKDIASGSVVSQGCPRLNKVIHGVFQSALWAIWNWRNRVVNSPPDGVEGAKEEDIFPTIQRISKTWISAHYSLQLIS